MQRLIVICLFLISCDTGQKSDDQKNQSEEIIFHGDVFGYTDSLYVHFQGGFRNDSALVLLNGEKVKNINLSSDPVLGFADDLVFPIKSVDALEMVLKRNGKEYSVRVDSVESNFLGIYFDYESDDLKYWFRKEPFLYE